MNRLKNAFNKQESKYGGYTALVTTIMIMILIVINLLVGEMDLTFDASVNRVFSISEASEEVAKTVSEPVSIYGLFEIGAESRGYDIIVSNYSRLSQNITSSTIDPIKNPAFAMKYGKEGESLPDGTYIVVAEDSGRFKVINSEDIIARSIDASSGEQVNAIVLEQQITSAIKYVTSTDHPVVYQVVGHGEEPLAEAAQVKLDLENYTINELVLMDEGMVPDDCGMLLINAPTKDINEAELEMLNAYFDQFGSALFMLGMVEDTMPNYSRLFENYGVNVRRDSMVFETKASNFYQSPVLLIPNIEEHPITEPLVSQDERLTAMASQYVEPLDLIRDELVIEALLTTSNGSYAKKDMTNVTIPEKEDGDAQGPFIIAAAITDNQKWDTSEGIYHGSKIIIVANSVFLKAEAYATEPNFDFLLYCTNWLTDTEDTSAMFIQPKNVDIKPLQMNAKEIYIYAAISVIVIPLVILVTGFVVWRKRRHL